MNIQEALKLIRHHNERDFQNIALTLFRKQFSENRIYGAFCSSLGIIPDHIMTLEQIPFLPVSFFKTHKVLMTDHDEPMVFESSGTTRNETSRHYVAFPDLYVKSFTECFSLFYGDPADYIILSLLPSYLERTNSSLVYMMNELMKRSGNHDNGFYLRDYDKLMETLMQLRDSDKKIMLFGVSFALLELAEEFSCDFPGLMIFETGGMKGTGKEITRKELHDRLMSAFRVDTIHSEYGMTELLSQAWSSGHGLFRCPPWMRVMIREPNDPLTIAGVNTTGGVNVVDFANTFSCPFIATDDLGRINHDGTFEVIGRFDYSAIRGCNTMLNDRDMTDSPEFIA